MERNKANGKKENIMEKVFTHGLVAQSMRVIGRTREQVGNLYLA